MLSDDILESALRTAGDFAGVFEYDGETGYFYLYSIGSHGGQKIVGSVHILSEEPDFVAEEVAVRWDRAEERVGLFIRGELWAVIDCERRSAIGGNYRSGVRPSVPREISGLFAGA